LLVGVWIAATALSRSELIGRLLDPMTHNDVNYLIDGIRRLVYIEVNGIWAEYHHLRVAPLHAPFSAYQAALGFMFSASTIGRPTFPASSLCGSFWRAAPGSCAGTVGSSLSPSCWQSPACRWRRRQFPSFRQSFRSAFLPRSAYWRPCRSRCWRRSPVGGSWRGCALASVVWRSLRHSSMCR
jgi:hypothetical protein